MRRTRSEADQESLWTLNLPIKPQTEITSQYGKGSQTKWSNRFNLVLCVVWLVVLIAAGLKLFDGKTRRRGVDEVGLCRR
jgi:hypothetical protein